jgi:hypothetical protein
MRKHDDYYAKYKIKTLDHDNYNTNKESICIALMYTMRILIDIQ